MNKFKKIFFNKGSTAAYAIVSAIFTIVPDDLLISVPIADYWESSVKLLLIRILICFVVFLLSNGIYCRHIKKRKKVSINGNNYTIQVEYGDLLSIHDGKTVINFDECFTTTVGNNPADIKPDSICGQYLKNYPIDDMKALINKAGVKPERKKSEYNNQDKYVSGTIVPNGDFLLLAFAKLDQNGLGHLTYAEYLDCLNKLWEEIDKWHGTNDVYVPVLGSKITRFDKDLTQQELLDVMIHTYLLSPKKMKKPFKLHIVCHEREGFSLNNILGVD